MVKTLIPALEENPNPPRAVTESWEAMQVRVMILVVGILVAIVAFGVSWNRLRTLTALIEYGRVTEAKIVENTLAEKQKSQRHLVLEFTTPEKVHRVKVRPKSLAFDRAEAESSHPKITYHRLDPTIFEMGLVDEADRDECVRWMWMGGGAIALCFLTALGIWQIHVQATLNFAQSSVAVLGTIQTVAPTLVQRGKARIPGHLVTYDFDLCGKAFGGYFETTEQTESIAVGNKLTILYNPQNPSSHRPAGTITLVDWDSLSKSPPNI